MYLSDPSERVEPLLQRRRFSRLEIQCRARIRIGDRQYAGYIHNISRGGAKLRTITPIRRLGTVVLRLPDLPPLRCRLCWTDAYHAGVTFESPLSASELPRTWQPVWRNAASWPTRLRSSWRSASLESGCWPYAVCPLQVRSKWNQTFVQKRRSDRY